MRYFLNVYWTGFVYIGLRFYTGWTETSRSTPHSRLPSWKSHALSDRLLSTQSKAVINL